MTPVWPTEFQHSSGFTEKPCLKERNKQTPNQTKPKPNPKIKLKLVLGRFVFGAMFLLDDLCFPYPPCIPHLMSLFPMTSEFIEHVDHNEPVSWNICRTEHNVGHLSFA